MASSPLKDDRIESSVIPISQGDVRDDLALARLGKKPVLKRRFGPLAILGYSCTVLITWEGSLSVFLISVQNGGPAGLIYGYLLVWIGTTSTYAILSELVSMAPTSGGQYHWVAMLAPRGSERLLSYMSAWLTIWGWIASAASGGFYTGGLIQALIVLVRPDTYIPKTWHIVLFYWAVIGVCVFINVATGWLLPKFEGALLILHIFGFFAILIPLLVLGPHGDAKEIFTTFLNLGGWNTQGLAFCISLMGSVTAFVGGDGPVHLAEEIRDAPIVVPRSIMLGIAINGALGFAMILTVLMRVGDLNAVLEGNAAFPFVVIFHNAVRSRAGAAIMLSIVFTMTTTSNAGMTASVSRIVWAFARDRGVPGWRTLSKISKRTSIPTYAVLVTSIITCLLGLINMGSVAAFNGVLSVAIAGLFGSYLLTTGLLLYRRSTGAIVDDNGSFETSTTSDGKLQIRWGPWKIPGVLGIANNIFAFIYLLFVFFFSFWPNFAKVTAQNMNWSPVVTVLIAIFVGVYYYFWAKHTYRGPIVDIDALTAQSAYVDHAQHSEPLVKL